MNKFIRGIVILLIIFFAYEYQKPVVTTNDAMKRAIECINNPPKHLAINPIDYTLKDIQAVHTSIDVKRGFLSQLTNQRELSVTLIFNEVEPTVNMNAYTGKCIRVTGPFN